MDWWGIGLADHIDNITYILQGFANETIRGFEYLSDVQRSHRLTLLKHDMALDYILARQGGLCVALKLTGDACYMLVPDTSDNITSVIDACRSEIPTAEWTHMLEYG
uniref:Profilin n=1 Tax=Amphiprion ocellaris TaxID=80972 RepID=A0AAQ5XRZ2_AMPOC